MTRGRTSSRLKVGLGVVAMCLALGPTQVMAQSASPPMASPAASSTPVAGGPVPLAWSRNTKGQGFDKDPFFTDLAQAADGTVVMTGAVRDRSGHVTAAAWRTTDERVWSRVDWEAPKPSSASGIVATPTGFIAVGGGVWTSADGITWAYHVVPDAGFRDVALTADGLVAIGQPAPGGPQGVPTLWTAPAATMMDPTTWKPQALATVGYPQRVAVAPDGTILGAGGLYGGANAPTPVTWSLRDGVVTTGTFEGLTQAPTAIVDLRRTPIGFVAAIVQNVGGGGTASVWVSSDGTSWTKSLDVTKGTITALGTIGTQTIVFGTNTTWQTGDGTTWQETPTKAFKGYGISTDIELADGRLLGGATLYTGPNTSNAATFLGQIVLPSIDWTADPVAQDFGANPGAADVAQLSGGSSVIVGHVTDAAGQPLAAAWSSNDAATWTPLTVDRPARSFASAVVPWQAGSVAVGFSLDGSGLVWTSPDGSVWTGTTIPGTTLADVQIDGASLEVLGRSGATQAPTVWTGATTDPAAWQATTIAASGIPQHLAMAADGAQVVVGVVFDTAGVAQLTLWQSSDGASWTPVQLDGLPASAVASDLVWTPAGFLLSVEGYRKNAPVGMVWHSSDGLAWQQTLNVSHGTVTALGIAGANAIAFSTDGTWQSANGLIWQKSSEPAFHGYSIAAVTTLADGRLLAVGQQSTGGNTSRMATWTGTIGDASAP